MINSLVTIYLLNKLISPMKGDKELMEALVLDAEVTSMFHSDNTRWGKYYRTVLGIDNDNKIPGILSSKKRE